jgi:predicted MPP superfamily phosphohydrolase
LRVTERPEVRFAYFTDLHFKGNPGLFRAVIARIHRWRPDFAVFGGDLIEEARDLESALELVRTLEVPLYGVPGNHDYWSGVSFERVTEAFRATGGAWLMDAAVEAAGGRARVSGFTCLQGAGLAPRPGTRNVAVLHYPVFADQVAPGFDLLLAGHSHGGQVRVPGYGAVIKPTGVGPYELGRFATPAGPLYVSAGVGTFYLNVRFLCPPEVVFVEV